jgi:TP901 family phage tail tape measure protein
MADENRYTIQVDDGIGALHRLENAFISFDKEVRSVAATSNTLTKNFNKLGKTIRNVSTFEGLTKDGRAFNATLSEMTDASGNVSSTLTRSFKAEKLPFREIAKQAEQTTAAILQFGQTDFSIKETPNLEALGLSRNLIKKRSQEAIAEFNTTFAKLAKIRDDALSGKGGLKKLTPDEFGKVVTNIETGAETALTGRAPEALQKLEELRQKFLGLTRASKTTEDTFRKALGTFLELDKAGRIKPVTFAGEADFAAQLGIKQGDLARDQRGQFKIANEESRKFYAQQIKLLQTLRTKAGITDEEWEDAISVFTGGTTKLGAVQRLLQSAADDTSASFKRLAGETHRANDAFKPLLADYLRFGKIQAPVSNAASLRSVLGATPTVLKQGDPTAVKEFEENYTRLINFMSRNRIDFVSQDFQEVVQAFRGDFTGPLIGPQITLKKHLDATFGSLTKAAVGIKDLYGELERFGEAQKAYGKIATGAIDTGLRESLDDRQLKNLDRVTLPQVNIKEATTREKKLYDEARDDLIQHLLKNKKLIESVVAEGPTSFLGKVARGDDANLSAAEAQLIGLLGKAQEAYNRVGFAAKLTAATEIRGRRDVVNAIKQSIDPIRALEAAQADQRALAEQIQLRAVTSREEGGLGLQPPEVFAPGVKFPEAALKRYYTNLGTVRLEANSTTLSLKQLDEVFAAIDDPSALQNLDLAQKRLYTGLSTLKSAYENLNEIRKAGRDPEERAIRPSGGIDVESEQFLRQQLQQRLNAVQNTLVSDLKPINLPVGANVTQIDKALNGLKATLESTKTEAVDFDRLFSIALTGSNDEIRELEVGNRKVVDAIRAVLNAENDVRLATAQSANEAERGQRQRIAQLKETVGALNLQRQVTERAREVARQQFVLPSELPTGTPEVAVNKYREATSNLQAVLVRTGASAKDFRDALAVRTNIDDLDSLPSILRDVREAQIEVINSYYAAEKAAQRASKEQVAASERAAKAARQLQQDRDRSAITRLIREQVTPTATPFTTAIPAAELAVQNLRLVENPISDLLKRFEQLELGLQDAIEIFEYLGETGNREFGTLSANAQKYIGEIDAVKKKQLELNAVVDKANAPGRREERRAEATQIVEREILPTLPRNIEPDKRSQINTTISNIIEKFTAGESSVEAFQDALDDVRAGRQLIDLPRDLQEIFNSLNGLAVTLDKVGASFRNNGATVRLLKEPLRDLEAELRIVRADTETFKKAMQFSRQGLSVGPISQEIVEIGDAIRSIREEGERLGLSQAEVNRNIRKYAREQIEDNAELIRSEREVRREKEREADIRRSDETRRLKEVFPGVAEAFGPVSSRITGVEFDSLRNQLIDISNLAIKAGFSQDKLKEAIKRAQDVVKRGAGGGGGGGGGGFVPPEGPDDENLHRNLVKLAQDFENAGNAGSRAGRGITISWQGVARLFQAHVLHTVLAEVIGDFRQALAAATEFEGQIALLKTITTEADGTFVQWSNTLREVSDQIGKPSVEVAKAAYDALSNQVTKTTEDTARFTTIAGNFARVTGSTTPDAVNLLSSAINAFGHTADDTEQIAASFFSTIDKGRVKASELANTYGRTSAFAKALGLDYEDVNAATVVLTQTGVSAADALTQINAVFSKLIKPTETTNALFKELGVTTGQELIQAFGGLGGALQVLAQEAAKGNVDFTDIFNELRSGRGSLTLAEDAAKAFQQALIDVRGDTQRFREEIEKFDQISAGVRLRKEMQQFRNFITDDLGGRALGFVDTVVSSLGSIAEALNTITTIDLREEFDGLNNTLQTLTTAAVELGKAFALYATLQIGTSVFGAFAGGVRIISDATAAAQSFGEVFKYISIQLGHVIDRSKLLSAVFARISLPILIPTGLYLVYDQFVKKAAGSIHTIGDEFKGTFEVANEANLKITQSYDQATRKQVQFVKDSVQEQTGEYSKLVTQARKELNTLASGQEAITKDITGRLESVFKSIADSFDEGIERTKSKISDLKKDLETIKDTRTDIIADFSNKQFDFAIAAQPERKTELTLERVQSLELQKAEALRARDVERLNALRKEQASLIDTLEAATNRLYTIERRRTDLLSINQQVQRFVPPDFSAIRRAQDKVNKIREEGLRQPATVPLDLSPQVAAVQDLADTVRKVTFNEQGGASLTRQMVKLNVESQRLLQSLTGANGQLLDANQILEIREKLAANDLKYLQLMGQETQVVKAREEERLANQQFIGNEYKRILDLINEESIRDKTSGDLLPPEKLQEALKRIREYQAHATELFKIQASLDPNFDQAKFKQQLEKLDTEVQLKLNSLEFEAAIGRQQQHLNETSKDWTALSQKALEALDKITQGINEANAALLDNNSNVKILAQQINARLSNLANPFLNILTPAARAALVGVQKEITAIANRATIIENADRLTAQLKTINDKLQDANITLIERKDLEKELAVLTAKRNKIGDVDPLRRQNEVDIQDALLKARGGKLQFEIFDKEEGSILADKLDQLELAGETADKSGRKVDELFKRLEGTKEFDKDPIKFLDENTLVSVNEVYRVYKNNATEAITFVNNSLREMVHVSEDVEGAVKSVQDEIKKVGSETRRIENTWTNSTKSMADRAFELVRKISQAFQKVEPIKLQEEGLQVTRGTAQALPRQLFGIEQQAAANRPRVIRPGQAEPAVAAPANELTQVAQENTTAVSGIGEAFKKVLEDARPTFNGLISGLTSVDLVVKDLTGSVKNITLPNVDAPIAAVDPYAQIRNRQNLDQAKANLRSVYDEFNKKLSLNVDTDLAVVELRKAQEEYNQLVERFNRGEQIIVNARLNAQGLELPPLQPINLDQARADLATLNAEFGQGLVIPPADLNIQPIEGKIDAIKGKWQLNLQEMKDAANLLTPEEIDKINQLPIAPQLSRTAGTIDLTLTDEFEQYRSKISQLTDIQLDPPFPLEASQNVLNVNNALDIFTNKATTIAPVIGTIGFAFQSIPNQAIGPIEQTMAALGNLVRAAQEAKAAIAAINAAPAPVAEGRQRGGRVGYFSNGGLVPVMTTPGERFISPELTSRYYDQLVQMNKGITPQFYTDGGFVRRGTDTQPGFLPAGSFVMNKRSSIIFKSILDDIASGRRPVNYYQTGGPVIQPYAPKTISRSNSSNSSIANNTTIGDIHVNVTTQTNDPNQLASQVGRAISRNIRLGRSKF